MKTRKNHILCGITALTLSACLCDKASSAVFEFRVDNAATNLGDPTDDGQSFQQIWGRAVNWTLVSGVDDGDNGYPDGTDTAIIDRTSGVVNNSTRLTEEGSPAGLTSIAGIIGTGTGNQDIVLKLRDFTIGDLECLESPNPFNIRAERDRSITMEGVISGPGSLLLSRSGGFSDGVDEDELITITGTEPNTITGNIRLYNDNNSSDNPQPSYWVADKVGAFGQAPELILEGRSGANGGIASLRITANAAGGEGAIDDQATTLFIGAKGILSLDAGVNEAVAEGKLLIDLEGTGTYTEVPAGTYDNTEPWIMGDGTFTVGAPTSGELAITSISHATSGDGTTVSLTWNSSPSLTYAVRASIDLVAWDLEVEAAVSGDEGDATTFAFDPTSIPGLPDDAKVFFRIEEVTGGN